jgi:hypothetical protein
LRKSNRLCGHLFLIKTRGTAPKTPVCVSILKKKPFYTTNTCIRLISQQCRCRYDTFVVDGVDKNDKRRYTKVCSNTCPLREYSCLGLHIRKQMHPHGRVTINSTCNEQLNHISINCTAV